MSLDFPKGFPNTSRAERASASSPTWQFPSACVCSGAPVLSVWVTSYISKYLPVPWRLLILWPTHLAEDSRKWLGSPSGCCRCLSDWFCLSCLANKSSVWWDEWPELISLCFSLSHTHTTQSECISFAPGAHSNAYLYLFVGHSSDERWLAWYVLCVRVCEYEVVCEGAGGNVDAWVLTTWALLCMVCIWVSTLTACLIGMVWVCCKAA